MCTAGLALPGCEGDDNSGGGGGQVTDVAKTNADITKGETSESDDDAAVTGSERPAPSGNPDQPRTTGTTGGGASGRNE
jgi:hypothetical protein